MTSQADLQDRVAYYAADGKIRASDTRTVADPNVAFGSFFTTTFEEYRYDALGRRIWVRARRFCEFDPMQYHAECNLDKVMRTVWDGDDELYEIQMPGQDGSPYLENDVGQVVLPMDNTGSGYAVDPNPFYGRVAYTHVGGTDQPLSVIRMGYGDRVNEGNVDAGHRALPAFAIFPLWSTRGQADLGVFADGGLRACVGSGSTARCVYNNWPGTWFAYARPTLRRSWWHGSVVEDKKDASGLHYRRNRQYDPSTGRFTQEDPIGLAGGMNLYGFAGGDPVNYSDPTGLIPVPLIIAAAWALYEVGSAAYDSYQAYKTLRDPNASDMQKTAMVAAATASIFGPGGGGTLVIGKMDDLARGVRSGERTLVPRMSNDLGSPAANWRRNSGLLREEMAKGKPIRDASVDPRTGALLDDRKANGSGSFLTMERNLLRDRGWTYDPRTQHWNPPQR